MGFFIKDMAGVPRIIIEILKGQLDFTEAPDLSSGMFGQRGQGDVFDRWSRREKPYGIGWQPLFPGHDLLDDLSTDAALARAHTDAGHAFDFVDVARVFAHERF